MNIRLSSSINAHHNTHGMLVKKLIYMDRSLSTMLSPPMPVSEEDRRVWLQDTCVHFPGPVLAQWDPPAWVKKTKKVFWLSENVTCSQRGYYDEDVYTKYLQAASISFQEKTDPTEIENRERIMRTSLSHMAFDFLITVVTPNQAVAAGCVVELRPALNTKEAACLYISTLCTNPEFRRMGLARQLVHAVYTLGAMLLEKNKQSGVWYNAIPSNQLFIGLHVRHTLKHGRQFSDTDASNPNILRKMYASCGLTEVSSYPKYESFTPYSRCPWEMDTCLEELTPMMQEVSSKFIYQDPSVSILHPRESGGLIMYHTFPMEYMDFIRESGIVYKKHNSLFNPSKDAYTPDTITFSKTKPANACSFCINVSSADADVIELKISAPSFFSCAIIDAQGRDIKQTQHTP